VIDMYDNVKILLYDSELNKFAKVTEAGSIMGRFSYEKNDEGTTALQAAGLDPEKLEFMDSAERRELLKKAGLDPYEFDLGDFIW